MISERSARIPPFYVMEILEMAHVMEADGADIVHLEVGEPDFETPAPIIEAAARSMRGGMTHYTHSLGIPQLREEIARYHEKRYGTAVSPDNVLVTNGTSPAMALIFSALLDPGDKVVLADPCYACYPNIVELVGGEPEYVQVFEEDSFKYRPEHIAARMGERVKGVMVNSPSNPTGIVLSEVDTEEIVRAVDGRAFIISDEIYHGLVYEGREHSMLEFTEQCFIVNGFSKLYAMTGWRLGYVICPPGFVRPMQKMQQNLYICANSFVQHAGIAALTDCEQYVREMVGIYDKRRRYMLQRVKQMGFGVSHEPTGAFYVLANAKRFTDDSLAFCEELLREAGVAVAPGLDFGPGGEGYVRFTYANNIENIREGCDRLAAYLEKREAGAS